MCAKEECLIKKAYANGKLCEFLIKYSSLLKHPYFKDDLVNFKKFFTIRCLQLSINEGCIISWLTFATFYPEMINDNYYPYTNMNGFIYKNMNIKYIETNEIFKK